MVIDSAEECREGGVTLALRGTKIVVKSLQYFTKTGCLYKARRVTEKFRSV